MTANDVCAKFPSGALDFDCIATEFSKYHVNPTNVLLHAFTTPLGLLGAVSFLRSASGTSSMGITLVLLYLLSLLREVNQGVFAGSVLTCGMIMYLAKRFSWGPKSSVAVVAIAYLLQDLAHLATGEQTFQSSYSDGGHVDIANPKVWLRSFMEHCYYLLPLCVHISLPFLPGSASMPASLKLFLEAPIPSSLQQLHVFAWLWFPLFGLALGSYCIDSKNGLCFFPGQPYYKRVLRCNIAYPSSAVSSVSASNSTTTVADASNNNSESRQGDLKIIREWVMSQKPSTTTSSHWWYNELPSDVRLAFLRISSSSLVLGMFRTLFGEKHYLLDIVHGMNEVYVTGPSRSDEQNNSDQVFYSRHVDGPWGLVPYVSLFRCIVGMDDNERITTHFPLANLSCNAKEGDVLAFDFNREVHYISETSKEDQQNASKTPKADPFRVVLKLHYCVYPRVLAPLGWFMHGLNVRYNQAFRALFLKTINPSTLYEHFLAWNVNFNTYVFDQIETYLGQRNVIYLGLVAAIWWATGCYEVFMITTSFSHYFRYISTFYVRRGIDFGSFKRDVLLFKTLALAQLFYHYFFPTKMSFQIDIVSIVMIASGYAVSVMATNAIGIDRTYFAAELGLVEPKWITQFPYGYIPHPMIVSQMWALLGFMKAAHFRADWSWVVPVHVLLYFTHMMQEHFDFYKRYNNKHSSNNNSNSSETRRAKAN